jgi:hypothetical protein
MTTGYYPTQRLIFHQIFIHPYEKISVCMKSEGHHRIHKSQSLPPVLISFQFGL